MIMNVTTILLLFVTWTMTTAFTVMKKRENVNQVRKYFFVGILVLIFKQDVVMIKIVLEMFLFALDNMSVHLKVSQSLPRLL